MKKNRVAFPKSNVFQNDSLLKQKKQTTNVVRNLAPKELNEQKPSPSVRSCSLISVFIVRLQDESIRMKVSKNRESLDQTARID